MRYSTHAEAAVAIRMGNTHLFFGKPIKCSWGSKPTPPGTSSTPLPPPAPAAYMPGISATNLAAYERQMALSKMASAQALMHPQGQFALKHAAMGMGAAGVNPAMYDAGFQNIGTTQQLMYYQQ